MTDESATLAAAAFALAGALATAGVAVFNESRRRREVREASELKELRMWTSRVFRHLFSLQHETEWITWHARVHPSSVTTQMVAEYEAAVHAAYPRVLGAMAVVASMDLALYGRLKDQLDALYRFEGLVANDALSVPSDAAVTSLGDKNETAKEFYLKLPEQLAAAMATAKVQTPAELPGAGA